MINQFYKVVFSLLITVSTIFGLSAAPAYAVCGSEQIDAIAIVYEVNDSLGASLQAAGQGKPENIRGLERRQLVLTKTQSYERTFGRYWRVDHARYRRELDEVIQKMSAGEVVGLPVEHYREEIEDKIVKKTPTQTIHFDVIKNTVSVQENGEAEGFSEPGFLALISPLLDDIANKVDISKIGQRTFAGQSCEMVKAIKPFQGEFCSFRHGVHQVTLYKNLKTAGEHRYEQKAIQVNLQACVSSDLFSIPAVVWDS